jgi:hypothetical protein
MNYGGSPYHKQRLKIQKKNFYISNHKLPGGLGSTHTIIEILDSELNTVGPYGPEDDDDDDNNNNKATNQQICL